MRCSDAVLEELAKPLFSHRGGGFSEIYLGVIDKIRRLVGTEGRVAPFVGSGTGGVEFMLSNLISNGDRVLCLVNGHFSERLRQQASMYSSSVDSIEAPWGSAVSPRDVEAALSSKPDTDAVCVVSCETSTGAYTDIEAIGKLCRTYGVLLLVDHVSGFGNPLYMDRYGVDALVLSTHESFAAPPGMSFVCFSDRALGESQRVREPPVYMRLSRYLKFQDDRGEPPFTVPTTLMKGLNRNLEWFLELGVENFFENCKKMGDWLRIKMPYPIFTDGDNFSSTVSAFKAPMDAVKFVSDLKAKGVELAEGNGAYRRRVFRVGHGGVTSMEDIEYLLEKCISRL